MAKAAEKATEKATVKKVKYVVTVENNSNYCGDGACGAQFAHGQAVIYDKWAAEWFKQHYGYNVEEVVEEVEE